LIRSTILLDQFVCTPFDEEAIVEYINEFQLAGRNGACGSSDTAHIIHEMDFNISPIEYNLYILFITTTSQECP
jgi:hypothetical protein